MVNQELNKGQKVDIKLLLIVLKLDTNDVTLNMLNWSNIGTEDKSPIHTRI